MSQNADFYHDATGADALLEVEALDNPESGGVGNLLGRMGYVMSQVSRKGTGAFYHAERWGNCTWSMWMIRPCIFSSDTRLTRRLPGWC